MERSPHAFDFLKSPPQTVPGVCVAFGDESFLKRLVFRELQQLLLGDDQDAPISEFDDSNLEWRDVSDELATKSLFGPQQRIVLLRQADDFVSRHRSHLEDYVADPNKSATLILDVKSWPGNTRLAKSVASSGLTIACRAPQRPGGKSKAIDTPKLKKWIAAWAKSEHGIKLPATATQQLLDIVGTDLGLINQELAKLALSVEDPKSDVTPDMIVDIVGGWRTKTTWELLDAACDGNAAEALLQLDRLLMAGEHPQAMFGAFSWSLRRFAAATRAIERAERQGQRPRLGAALLAAGFRKFPHDALQRAESQLRQLGRDRAGKLHGKLLETDLRLKGSHSTPTRARHAMEMLLVGLSKDAAARRS